MATPGRSGVLSKGAAGVILAGIILCAFPAAWFGLALGYYPSRMVCAPETGYGSGCDEMGSAIAPMVFAFVVLPWAGLSLYLTLRVRQGNTRIRRWWPFSAFSVLTAAAVGARVLSALSDPYAYF